MSRHALALYERSFAERPAYDTAVSRALLRAAGEGRVGESLRVHQPGDVVAFSVLDRTRPGFADAVAAARAGGFGAILRLAGGRAAVFHRETVAFSWCIPDPDPRAAIRARFEACSALVASALASLGVDARVGAVAGEYCPGEHSVNARGRVKLMGVGQRLVRGATHVGGVIVVRESARVRDVLVPVYAKLGVAWNPETAGAVEDELPGVTRAEVISALLAAVATCYEITPAELPDSLLAEAVALEAEHRL